MAKKKNGAANVAVRLNCILSGHPGDPGPGAVVTLDADEAERLIDLGVAEIVEGGVQPDDTASDEESAADAAEDAGASE